ACINCLENEEDCYLPQCVTADGFEKGILTVNRRIPGPSIQCPILEDTAFRYDFIADTAGTMFCMTLHQVNGLQGSLIVRLPKKYEPHDSLYDFDLPAHHLLIMDWYHTEPETRMPGILHHDTTQLTTYYLLNGRGRYKFSNGTSSATPLHVFQVKQGKRYRFRVIGAVSTHCPAVVQIEKHKLLMIASDGSPFKPILVDSFTIFSGERYDFILSANAEPGTYWIQVKSVENCFKNDVYEMAILQYETSMDKTPKTPILKNLQLGNTILNSINSPCNEKNYQSEPDFNFEFVFGFHIATKEELFWSGNYPHFLQITPTISTIPHINNIQFITPASPLQSQYDDIPVDKFCLNGTDGLPACPFVIIDKANFGTTENHAFHLHGHTFNVIATGNLPDNLLNAKDITELMETKKIPISASPVFKDTLAVPSRGYAVVRFIANNPGNKPTNKLQ
ncbi:hypothetical protein L9F63_001212, partial [Diploptera punctata]